MIVESDRHRPGDIETWEREERKDALKWELDGNRILQSADRAIACMREFTSTRRGYVGVSWGKDSVVIADLAMRADIDWTLVHVKVRGLHNPDTDAVRDMFLGIYPDAVYVEIEADRLHPGGTSLVENPTIDGFEVAADRFGDAYISGVRGQESSTRQIRMKRWGPITLRTCAPIGRWSTDEVFCYLYARDLPVHPAYAYTMGGFFSRDELRTAAIGGQRGRGRNRLEWERLYYPELVHRMEDELGPQR